MIFLAKYNFFFFFFFFFYWRGKIALKSAGKCYFYMLKLQKKNFPHPPPARAVVFFIPMKILILGQNTDFRCKNTENGKSNLAALTHDARDCPGYISRSVCTIRRHVGGQHDVSENALYVEGI